MFYPDAGKTVSLQQGPDGSIYQLTYDGTISRIALSDDEPSRRLTARGPSGAADRRLLNWAEHYYPGDGLEVVEERTVDHLVVCAQ